jgi:hypothetical protein
VYLVGLHHPRYDPVHIILVRGAFFLVSRQQSPVGCHQRRPDESAHHLIQLRRSCDGFPLSFRFQQLLANDNRKPVSGFVRPTPFRQKKAACLSCKHRRLYA